MSTYVITGSASGIGLETANLLQSQGHRIIGIDLANCDVEADLGTAAGRDTAVSECHRLAPMGIDGLVTAAGISQPHRPADEISINYFGSTEIVSGLNPLLQKSGHAKVVVMGSTSALNPARDDVVQACLAGDETSARRLVTQTPGSAYCDSKRAITLWMRRTSILPSWAREGILLNGVAPGIVETAMTREGLADPETAKLFNLGSPSVLAGYATPADIAEVIAFLLTMKSSRMVGQMIFVDAGADAMQRTASF